MLSAQVNETTMAAAPPVCSTAAISGHSNTTLLTPVSNCNADKANKHWPARCMPGTRRKRQPTATNTANTTQAALRCTK